MIEPGVGVLLATAAALLAGGVIKGAVGFGLPMIATPVLVFFLPLPTVIALITLPVLISNLQQCWVNRAAVPVLWTIWPMVAANAVVLFLGSRLIVVLDGELVRLIVGALIVAYALVGESVFKRSPPPEQIGVWAFSAGAVSGAIGSVSSFYSFPSVQLLHAMRLAPNAFVFAVGTLMSTGFVALLLGIGLNGAAVIDNLGYSALAVLPVMLGTWLGGIMRSRTNFETFRYLVKSMLLATGLALIARSLG